MADEELTRSNGVRPPLEWPGIKRIVHSFISALIVAALLFLSAGRLDWPAAWIFCGLFLAYLLAVTIWGARADPDLMNERGRRPDNVKRWDQVLVALRLPLLFGIPVIAGLDAGRFEWSAVPLVWQVLGFIGFIPAMVLPVWAFSANRYLAMVVRIQGDRGHQVATTGPYRYVRHPMYVGTIFFGVCTPLFLGSWWALVPGGLLAGLFVVRTALEDRALREELPGYAEYAERVRYRLLPGVW